MQGLTTSLWPIHYKPLPDELLSCWLVRLAHGHGMKVQTFCNILFGNRLQVWNRDIDRLAPPWLVDELSRRTGTPLSASYATTLRAYEGQLFTKSKDSGALAWIQTLKMYHRKREGFGLQFCGACLADRPMPYFRKAWRVAFNTICTKHISTKVTLIEYDRTGRADCMSFLRDDIDDTSGSFSAIFSRGICHHFNFVDIICSELQKTIASFTSAQLRGRSSIEQNHDFTSSAQTHITICIHID